MLYVGFVIIIIIAVCPVVGTVCQARE